MRVYLVRGCLARPPEPNLPPVQEKLESTVAFRSDARAFKTPLYVPWVEVLGSTARKQFYRHESEVQIPANPHSEKPFEPGMLVRVSRLGPGYLWPPIKYRKLSGDKTREERREKETERESRQMRVMLCRGTMAR